MYIFITMHKCRGVGTFSEVGGLRSKIIKSIAHVGQSTHAGKQSIPNLGGLEACMPPRKFTLSEIESENISGP